jgi:hypothetical protein
MKPNRFSSELKIFEEQYANCSCVKLSLMISRPSSSEICFGSEKDFV